MKNTTTTLALSALGGLIFLAGCSSGNGPTFTPSTNIIPGGTYQQIERFGRPLTKEVFQQYNNHDATNRNSPPNVSGDAQLASEIQSFTSNFRAPAYGQAFVSILIPDELAADFSQPGPAAYLGVETGGFTGGKFGGRKPADDVVTISLGALFGNTLNKLGVVATDDGREIPCLQTDNVPAGSRQQLAASFPYVQGPQ